MGSPVERVLEFLKNDSKFKCRLDHIQLIPPKEAVYGSLPERLPEGIEHYLEVNRLKLYKHQCDAIEILRQGKNLVITTPTASGKTLAFNLPIFEALARDTTSTALYLYPTKALSNDQLKALDELEELSGIRVKPRVYDGDTPQSKRPKIRETSRIIISNPYELHQVLPWHHKWRKFLGNLKYVVIDEAHRYRGVFGSNVAFLVRRLRRICSYYNSYPQFILSTATLANPIEFAERLAGVKFSIISEDTSPKGKKYFIFYNPFYGGAGELSTHHETRDLFLFFVKNDLQTLCFTISRKMAELIASWTRDELEKSKSILAEKVTAYRAGYLPEERRAIEDGLKKGILRGITSTNALELGIDIGSLDSVIISGFPGTIISTWQQAGRAGRGTDDSCAVLVAFQNPLDQFFMKHPEVFFGKPHEHAIIDLENPYVVSGHLLCAAAERPVDVNEDRVYFGDQTGECLEELAQQNLVESTPSGWVYVGKGRATEAVSLETISPERFLVVLGRELLETMDREQAYREAHRGAILLHQGDTYLVEDLDLRNRLIKVLREDVDYHTTPVKVSEVKIIEELERKQIGSFKLSLGEVDATEQYIGFKKKKFDQVVGMEKLDLPALNFRTMGVWFTIPGEVETKINDLRMDFSGSLHGVEHALIALWPFSVMCDSWDIGGLSVPHDPRTNQATIFIYEAFEGGIGLSEKAYELFGDIARMTLQMVHDCRCEIGCPACIYSPRCGNENRPLDKQGTIILLQELLKSFAHTT